MLRKRKIKLAVLFISLLTVILVLLSMALSSVSLNYVTELGNVAVATDIKNNENENKIFLLGEGTRIIL